ncbi:ABC transporter permease subunit [Salipaludibacillus sp. LMS25]|uniref:ABC transporter permease subunit n=1 Tax=Salipaludibacillus sp. LMS25 TaxID=2924031 RepID=UPI0020D08E47|nr:ABC transporter permease subunit [Salipaludibacillus sp. LMS25]UTR14186.1 ABC transporter permease subunit [Salipaludibacillus sp. LMS25]
MMFHKALWYQSYKQTRLVIWMILALFVIHMPLQAILAIERWKEEEQMYFSEGYTFEFDKWDVLMIFSEGALSIFLTAAIIALACMLIGLERNTRKQDFTFSLPFYRKDIFLSKWLYGTFIIAVLHIIHFLIAYMIIYQSEYADVLNLVTGTEIFWSPFLGFLLFFTFALFIGTFTGEMMSQIALTVTFGVLPLGIYALLQNFISLHFNYYIEFPEWINYITPFTYVYDHTSQWTTWFFPVVFIALLLWVSVVLYTRNKIEHNGEFLIFKQLNPLFLVGITICFSLLGGMIVSSLAPGTAKLLSITAYWIGFVIFLFFSLLITKRLMTMNLTFRAKS